MKGELVQSRGGRFQVWDDPRPKSRYVVGCDVASGKVKDKSKSGRAQIYSYSDQRPDYSAMVVVEVETGIHVASWHGYIQPTELYPILAAIGFFYNTAVLVPEINGPGGTVVEGLTLVVRYPKVYRSKVWNKPDRDFLGGDWGWKTTMQSRPILMARVDEQLNGNTLFTRDKDLIRELRTMQIDDSGIPRAKGKDKDDRVFALALALQGRFELLYGTLTHQEEVSTLPDPDKRVWDTIHKQQELSALGHSTGSVRRRMRRMPRGSGLRHW